MANYFIGIDENGQPYIAHAAETADAVGGRSKFGRALSNLRYGASRRAKKYLQKVEGYYGKGKDLYLYTQDQVRAFANRGKRKVADAIGLTAKRRRDTALSKLNKGGLSEAGQKAYRNAANVNQEAYSKSLLGKADYAINKTRFKAKALKNRAVNKARDIAGYDEQERLQELQKQYAQARAHRNDNAESRAAYRALQTELDRAQEAYNKTLVGRRAKRKKGKK